MTNFFYKCFVITLLISFDSSAQSIEDSIVKIVEGKMVSTLSKIPAGKESSYGFSSRTDFEKCTVGKAIKVLTLNQNIKKDSIIEKNEWRVPIKLNNHNVLLFTVIKNKNNYEIVDLGGELLAKELELINLGDTKCQYLLRLYNLGIDFVTSSNNNNISNQLIFIPLSSAKSLLQASENKIKTEYKVSEIVELIQL